VTAAPLARGVTPFFSIFVRPRRTMRAIIDSNPRRLVLVLAALSGFGSALDNASTSSIGDGNNLPVIAIVAICVVVGALGGVLTLYIGGFVMKWAGRPLGGRATQVEVRAALAWSTVPLIWALVLWVPELALAGREMFTTATPILAASPLRAVLLVLVILLEVVLGIWSFVLFLKCLGEVHGFSAWKSLAAVLLALLAIVLVALIVALPVALVAAAA